MTADLDTFRNLAKSLLETNIYYHSLSLSACMAGIYDYLAENKQLSSNEPGRDDWILAGLIHDIDYQGQYKKDHPNRTADVLKSHNLAVSDTVLNIIKAHAPQLTGVQAQNKAQWAIFCADSLTGLIVAVGLVYPSKKLADVKLSSVTKRFYKEPRFASGTRRQEVSICQDKLSLNIPIDIFIKICLLAMQSIAVNIGL